MDADADVDDFYDDGPEPDPVYEDKDGNEVDPTALPPGSYTYTEVERVDYDDRGGGVDSVATVIVVTKNAPNQRPIPRPLPRLLLCNRPRGRAPRRVRRTQSKANSPPRLGADDPPQRSVALALLTEALQSFPSRPSGFARLGSLVAAEHARIAGVEPAAALLVEATAGLELRIAAEIIAGAPAPVRDAVWERSRP